MFPIMRLASARAASAAAVLASLASCSVLLDWETFSADYEAGAVTPPFDATSSNSDEATSADEGTGRDTSASGDAIGDALNDGGSAGDGSADGAPSDASPSDALPGDASPPDAQGDAPSCAQSCKGCCTAAGQCAFGTSNDLCGTSGAACQNCTTSSLACVNNVCATPTTTNPPPTCVPSKCSQNVCIPVWEGTCCNENQCGCMPLIPPGPCL